MISIKDLIKTHYELYINNSVRTPIFIRGKSGIGKSYQIREAAKELNIEFFDIRLSQFDPVDIKGLPFGNKDTGTTDWLPNSLFSLPADTNGIMLLDEITTIDPSMQSAIYEMLLDHKVGGLPLPANLMLVCAGNRQEDKGTYYPLAQPIYNRCITLDYDVNAQQWIEWANTSGVYHGVMSFIDQNPDYLHNFDGLEGAFASPRSWCTVSDLVNGYGEQSPMLNQLVRGAVGEAAMFAFMAYIKEVITLPSVKDVLDGTVRYPSGVKSYSMAFKIASHVCDKKDITQVFRFIKQECGNAKTSLTAEAMVTLFINLVNRTVIRTVVKGASNVTFDPVFGLMDIKEFRECLIHPQIKDIITNKFGGEIKNILQGGI